MAKQRTLPDELRKRLEPLTAAGERLVVDDARPDRAGALPDRLTAEAPRLPPCA